MRPTQAAVALSVVTLALAACSDQPTSAPVTTIPRQPSMAVIPRPSWIPAACNTTQLKSDSRAFVNKANDLLMTIAGDLTSEVSKKGLTRVATQKAFDGLSRIAQIRGTSAQDPSITADVFDRLVKGYLSCTELEVTAGADAPTPPGGGGFGLALGSHWVFEVRGKNNAPATIYDDPTGGAYERNKPAQASTTFWAVEPGVTDWATSIGGSLGLDRVFIYGYQTSSAAVPAKFGSSFEHKTIPVITKPVSSTGAFSMAVKIGLCGQTAVGGQRVNHDNVFLPLVTSFQCTTPAEILASSSSSSYAFQRLNPVRWAERAMSFFSPTTLEAAALVGVVGGSKDYLSPSSVYDLSQYQLGSLGTIADGRISQALHLTSGASAPVTVTVTVPGATATDPPVPAPDGTPVAISIVGNSSSIAYFSDGKGSPAVPTVTRYVSGGAGVVSFANVYLTKAGGYQVAFQVVLTNAATNTIDFANAQTISSNSFNMQGK